MNVPLPEPAGVVGVDATRPYRASFALDEMSQVLQSGWVRAEEETKVFLFAPLAVGASVYTADQLRQHEARVREQIAGEIAPLTQFAEWCLSDKFDSRDLSIRARYAIAASIALGTTPKD